MKKHFKLILNTLFLTTLLLGFFGFKVYADADKTQLIAANDELQSIIATQDASPEGNPFYEESSYAAFTTAINDLGGTAGIQAVIDDPAALQVDVDDLAANINTAIAGLITSDTYYSTMANFSTAKIVDLDPYTTDSQTAYNNEMDRIETILNDPTAGESAIQDLNDDIAAAADLLVLRGDKTTLLATKDEIDAIYAGDGLDYIPSTFQAFQDAYDDIDSVLLVDIGMTLTQLIDDIDALPEEVSIGEDRLDEILTILVLRPDKTTLIEDYQAALAVDETLYTSTSFSNFEAGLVLVLAVIDNPESLQADVDQALFDLFDLYDLLVEKADLSELSSLLSEAISQDISAYTPDSVDAYLAELSRINNIVEADDSNQTQADAAMSDFLAAGELLILQADRTALSALNQLIIVAYYEDRLSYTESSYASFKAAVDAYGSYLYVNTILNNDNIDQDTVDNLVTTLQNALDLLDLKIDNTELLNVYMTLENEDVSLYTANSQGLYYDELARIYAILNGNELNADAASQILIDFLSINSLLVALPDFTALQEIYDTSDIYREDNYSISSYGAFITAKENALSVINNANADTAMVDNAIQMLEDAIANLVIKAEMIFIFEGQTLDIDDYVTLGGADVVQYYTGDDSIITVDDSGVVTGMSFGESQVFIELSNGYTEVLDIHVKAKVDTTVYVLTFTIPVASVGLGAAIIYVKKDTWVNVWRIITGIFKRK